MRVLVTGGAGFIGRHLVKALIDAKHDVTCLVRNGKADYLSQTVFGDLRNIEDVERGYRCDPEVVFHLAAQAIVGNAQRDPLETFRDNVAGTWNILEVHHRHGPGVPIIVASSDKAYGELKTHSYVETDPLGGRGFYDVSKSCADLISQSFIYEKMMNVGIVRAGNVYGLDDRHTSRIIPSTISAIIGQRQVVLRSDGSPIRDYIYVDDIVDGYLTLWKYLRERAAGDRRFNKFNFSGGHPISVIDLVQMVRGIADDDFGIRSDEPLVLGSAAGEISNQVLSTIQSRAVLGWKPRTPLKSGLRVLIEQALR